jgi:hypothetical protein
MAQIPGSLASLFGLGDPEDLLKLAAGQLPLSTSPVTSARPASSAAPNPTAVSPEAAGAGQLPTGRVLATIPRTGAGPAATPGVTPDMAKALQPRSSDTLGGALHAGMQSHKPEYGPWGNLLAGMSAGMAYGDLAAAKDQERALETYKMMFEMQDRSAARQEALRQHEIENQRWGKTYELQEKRLALDEAARGAETTQPLPKEEYAKYNIPADYAGPVMRNAKGDISMPGKAATQVNIDKGETEYDKAMGKANAEFMQDVQKSGRSALSTIPTLEKMKQQVSDPNFKPEQGLGSVVNKMRKVAVSVGLEDANKLAPNELFASLRNKVVLDASGGSLGAQISNSDRQYIDATQGSDETSVAGIQRIIDINLATQRRKREVARMARKYAKQNGRLDDGFNDVLQEYAEKNPLFPNEGQAEAAPAPTGGASTAAPQGVGAVTTGGRQWKPGDTRTGTRNGKKVIGTMQPDGTWKIEDAQ